MANPNKITMSVAKELEKATDRAIQLIVSLTGEHPGKFVRKSPTEIFQYLSFLLQCEKTKREELHIEHDENQEIDYVALAQMWQLVSKGVVKEKKKTFGSVIEKFYEQIKFLMAKRGNDAYLRVTNNLGPMKSNVDTGIAKDDRYKSPKIVESGLSKVMASYQVKAMAISNDNGPSIGAGIR